MEEGEGVGGEWMLMALGSGEEGRMGVDRCI